MSAQAGTVLFLGYGNPGRLDDGLGPAFVEALERLEIQGVSAQADYQLSVEDAAALRDFSTVVFVDASVSGAEPFSISRIHPEPELSFTSHSIKPQGVLALAKQVFAVSPEAFLMSIRGYEFNEFEERLSERAKSNLDAALKFIFRYLKDNKELLNQECEA